MEIRRKKLIIYLVAAFLAGAVVTGGATALIFNGLLGYVHVSKETYDTMSDAYQRFGKLETLYKTIDQYYYQEADEDAMLESACKAYVTGLNDPYSSYMTATEYDSWKASATGKYDGVGITFSAGTDGRFQVVSVNEGSPAEKAGIKEGDEILSVDGKTYDDLETTAKAVRGEAGTQVKLTYSRNGTEKSVTITREEIIQHSVSHQMLDQKIGYIQVSSFLEATPDDFSSALEDLKEKGAKGLILDLRDNGGGLVNSAVEIADEFLDEGVVTYVEDKNGNRTEYDAEDGKTDLKTVLLVNENSASSSEILAAALQDNGFSLVGQKTYGKGVIQSTVDLKDGSALKLTIMQYFSPEGNQIHKKGLTPDYSVENPEDSTEDPQLEKALSLF